MNCGHQSGWCRDFVGSRRNTLITSTTQLIHIHRIGQRADRIVVMNLICEGTVDERIYDRLYVGSENSVGRREG